MPDPSLRLSVLIPLKSGLGDWQQGIRSTLEYFQSRFAGSFELVVVPNPWPSHDPNIDEALKKELGNHPNIKLALTCKETGKGRALAEGFKYAKGDWIVLVDADCPFDLEFINKGLENSADRADLIAANRRLLSTEFRMPVALLPLAYKRARAGVIFNSVARTLLGIPTTDTQAGLKILRRSLAEKVFARLTCPGFLYDLELFLVAKEANARIVESPVVFNLRSEKSTVRLYREAIFGVLWLVKIKWQQFKGHYR